MKATELLKHQHDEVKAIFKQLEGKADHAKARVEKLANSLSAHMVIEQELFYPAVFEADEDLVLESYEEHAVARFALKRLLKTEPSDETFAAKVTTLKSSSSTTSRKRKGCSPGRRRRSESRRRSFASA